MKKQWRDLPVEVERNTLKSNVKNLRSTPHRVQDRNDNDSNPQLPVPLLVDKLRVEAKKRGLHRVYRRLVEEGPRPVRLQHGDCLLFCHFDIEVVRVDIVGYRVADVRAQGEEPADQNEDF